MIFPFFSCDITLHREKLGLWVTIFGLPTHHHKVFRWCVVYVWIVNAFEGSVLAAFRQYSILERKTCVEVELKIFDNYLTVLENAGARLSLLRGDVWLRWRC